MKCFKIGLCFVMLLSLILIGPNIYAQSNRGASVPVDALPETFKEMEIKDYFIPTTQKKSGVIHALAGHVVVIHRATKDAYFGSPGDTLYENDSLNTLAKSRCRIRFFDEDVVTMAADTQFAIESFHDQRKTGKKRSLFSMLKGKAMSYAMRLFSYKETKFRLKTPTAVLGVRGTKFVASVDKHIEEYGSYDGLVDVKFLVEAGKKAAILDEKRMSDDGTMVADIGNEVGIYLAQAHQDRSFLLEPGDYINSVDRVVAPNPEFFRRMEQVISGIKVDPAVKKEVTDTGKTDPSDLAGKTNTQTDITQIETGLMTEEHLALEHPTTHFGYFCGLLTGKGSAWFEESFVSLERQNFDSNSVKANGSSGGYIEGRGGSSVYDDPHLAQAAWVGGDSGDLGTNHPISWVEKGYNSCMEWGYWLMDIPFTDGGNNYLIDNKGWYIFGEHTPDEAMTGFHGTVNYSGDAHGTYWTANGGTDMGGNFSCGVDFDSASISNFNLSVSGGDKSASITGAAGNFASSQFTLDIGTGSWKLKNGSTELTVFKRTCNGSLYGPNGEYMGGAFGMIDDANTQAAHGIFQGSKN